MGNFVLNKDGRWNGLEWIEDNIDNFIFYWRSFVFGMFIDGFEVYVGWSNFVG